MADSSMISKCTAEAIGTFVLIFTVGCNVLGGNAVWGGVSIACSLMVSIYALGGISGANFNPAVSIALGLSKAMKGPGLGGKEVGAYMVTQFVAGIMAAYSYHFLWGESFHLMPGGGFRAWQAFQAEFFYTFVLCFVVLNVAVAEKGKFKGNQFYGLAIGFVIVAGAYGAGAISGGCFNPAVTMGIGITSMWASGFWWVYLIAQFTAALFSAVLFKVVRPEEFGGEKGEISEYVSEFIGTFVLVLTVGLNVLGSSPAGAFSIAASLMCMIYALGDVSGAHFNPAVTATIYFSGRCSDLTAKKAACFIVSQMAGAMNAAFCYVRMYEGKSFALGPGDGFNWASVAIAESIFTFVLCYVVLCVAVSSGPTNSSTMFGLAIGACVTVGGNAIGKVSGGSLNPAVSFGISVGSSIEGGLVVPIVYTLFELAGAAAAAGVFAVTHASDIAKDTDDGAKHTA